MRREMPLGLWDMPRHQMVNSRIKLGGPSAATLYSSEVRAKMLLPKQHHLPSYVGPVISDEFACDRWDGNNSTL
ncbi:hypothetical protein L484_008529 [Morus notabilis]|uniref:Uncharacterized protein n=1 Tax=Morus notabilis TaxID=981085 RepID=W9S015_9ROSA|nr:hypothetical protein L484_008529 [Morus notabilis]